MIDREHHFRIKELGTDRHPSLEAAHQAAMSVLAQILANVIQSGLDNGHYFVENGVVRLSKEAKADEELSAGKRRPRLGILP